MLLSPPMVTFLALAAFVLGMVWIIGVTRREQAADLGHWRARFLCGNSPADAADLAAWLDHIGLSALASEEQALARMDDLMRVAGTYRQGDYVHHEAFLLRVNIRRAFAFERLHMRTASNEARERVVSAPQT